MTIGSRLGAAARPAGGASPPADPPKPGASGAARPAALLYGPVETHGRRPVELFALVVWPLEVIDRAPPALEVFGPYTADEAVNALRVWYAGLTVGKAAKFSASLVPFRGREIGP